MIIKKTQFGIHKKYRGKWPFNVDQVAVVKFQVDKYAPFAILHEYRLYALSGMLESHGLPKLEDSGIWAEVVRVTGGHNVITGRKSLQSFFDFITEQSKDIK